MNRSEIRTLVRTFINEPSAGFWSNAELNSYIDLGDRKLNAVIKSLNSDYFTKSATFSTVADTKSYSLPSDYIDIRRLEHYNASDNSEITQIPQGDFPEVERTGYYPFADTGKPYRYIIIGTRMDLLPVPDDAYTLRIFYEYLPDSLSDDSGVPSSPVEYHDMIAYYASILALAKNSEDAKTYKDLYDGRMEDLVNHQILRKGSESTAVIGYMENY